MKLTPYKSHIKTAMTTGARYSSNATPDAFGASQAESTMDIARSLQQASNAGFNWVGQKKREEEMEARRLAREQQTAANKAQREAEKAANRASALGVAEYKYNSAGTSAISSFYEDVGSDFGMEYDEQSGNISYDDEAFSSTWGLGVDVDYIFSGSGSTADTGSGTNSAQSTDKRIVFNGYNPTEATKQVKAWYDKKMAEAESEIRSNPNIKEKDALNLLAARKSELIRTIDKVNSDGRKAFFRRKEKTIGNQVQDRQGEFFDAINNGNYGYLADIHNEWMSDKVSYDNIAHHLAVAEGDRDSQIKEASVLQAEVSKEIRTFLTDNLANGDIETVSNVMNEVGDLLAPNDRDFISDKLVAREKEAIADAAINMDATTLHLALQSGDKNAIGSIEKLLVDKGYTPKQITQIHSLAEKFNKVKDDIEQGKKDRSETAFQDGLRKGKVLDEWIDPVTGETIEYDVKKVVDAKELLRKRQSNIETEEGKALHSELDKLRRDDPQAIVDRMNSLTKEEQGVLTQEQWDEVDGWRDDAVKEMAVKAKADQKATDEAVKFINGSTGEGKTNSAIINEVFDQAKEMNNRGVPITDANKIDIVKEAISMVGKDVYKVRDYMYQKYVYEAAYRTVGITATAVESPDALIQNDLNANLRNQIADYDTRIAILEADLRDYPDNKNIQKQLSEAKSIRSSLGSRVSDDVNIEISDVEYKSKRTERIIPMTRHEIEQEQATHKRGADGRWAEDTDVTDALQRYLEDFRGLSISKDALEFVDDKGLPGYKFKDKTTDKRYGVAYKFHYGESKPTFEIVEL